MRRLILLIAVLGLTATSGCDSINMDDPETRRQLSGMLGDMQASNQAVERASNSVINVAAYESMDAYGNHNGSMRSTANGETTVKEYRTTYDGHWVTTTNTTKTTRR